MSDLLSYYSIGSSQNPWKESNCFCIELNTSIYGGRTPLTFVNNFSSDKINLLPVIEYSTDLISWTPGTWGGGGSTMTLPVLGKDGITKVYIRAQNKNNNFSIDKTNYIYLQCSGAGISVKGNIMSLLDKNMNSNYVSPYAFANFFDATYTERAEFSQLKLPATVLSEGCYYNMFYYQGHYGSGTTTWNIDLPAKVIPVSAYEYMFDDCLFDNNSKIHIKGLTFNSNSCRDMFRQITTYSAAKIEVDFNQWPSNLTNWISTKTSTKGTFICPTNLTISSELNGWTIQRK